MGTLIRADEVWTINEPRTTDWRPGFESTRDSNRGLEIISRSSDGVRIVAMFPATTAGDKAAHAVVAAHRILEQSDARRFRAVESCIDEGCKCDDRAGVVLYDGPNLDDALGTERRARNGYTFVVEQYVDGEWVAVQ